MPTDAPPGIELDLESAEEQRRLRVLTMVTIAMVVMGPFFIYQYLSLEMPAVSTALAVTMLAGLLNLVWARRRMGSHIGGWIATFILFGMLVFSNLQSGGFYDPNFGWLYVFPMLAALLVDARAGWIFTGLVLLTALAFWIGPEYGFEISNRIPPERHAEQSLANRISAVLAIGIILAAIASHQRFARQMLERANRGLQQEMEHRSRIQQRLVRSERAASMGNLAAGLAHEINNPLTYVIGNLELLQTDPQNDASLPTAEQRDESQRLLADALEGAFRVANLVRDLRTFSYVVDDNIGSIALDPVIEKASRLVANEIRHRASLELDCERNLHVLGNEGRIQEILVNLLINAAHSIEAGAAAQNHIRISAHRTGERVLLKITDSGTGIRPEILDRIFEPLFTTKAVGIGTGMGLFITDNIVKSMGGEITVASTLGSGSTFSVLLNRSEPVETATSEASEPRDVAPEALRGLRILVIDDEESVLVYLRRALAHHDLVTEKNPRTALERVLREPLDVILCDLMMPEMTGMDLYAEVQRRRPEIAQRMLFMTAGIFTEQSSEFLSVVRGRWTEKPIVVADLERLIRDRIEAIDGSI